MSKTPIAIVLLAISGVAFYVYFASQPPTEIESKGNGNETTTALVSLVTAIVSLLTAIGTLITKWIEVRSDKRKQV